MFKITSKGRFYIRVFSSKSYIAEKILSAGSNK